MKLNLVQTFTSKDETYFWDPLTFPLAGPDFILLCFLSNCGNTQCCKCIDWTWKLKREREKCANHHTTVDEPPPNTTDFVALIYLPCIQDTSLETLAGAEQRVEGE